MNPDRLPLLMFVLAGLVIVAVVGMSTGSWVWFGIALAVHLIASFFVISGSIKSARTGTDADDRSAALDRKAGEAVGNRPRNVETEVEALKREPSSRV
jgi:hypothetical protein